MPEHFVDDSWLGASSGPVTLIVKDGELVGVVPEAPRADSLSRTVLPGLVDHHVHLGLVDRAALAEGPVVAVQDLGWALPQALSFRSSPPSGVRVRIAGPFHTAPGGYPSGRSWAPPGSVRELSSVADARIAVSDAAAGGVDTVKVALHAGMGVLDDAVLAAVVAAARDLCLQVCVHAEGPGQAARAIDAGADVLVHAPWTEVLEHEVLVRGRHMTWYSTLAIHSGEERAVAMENVRRFRAVGGQVRYGTDMGNGPAPVGVNGEEVLALGEAGLSGDALLTALTGDLTDPVPAAQLLVSPHPVPDTAAQTLSWLADCERLPLTDDEECHVS